jgi:hypothetical protein
MWFVLVRNLEKSMRRSLLSIKLEIRSLNLCRACYPQLFVCLFVWFNHTIHGDRMSRPYRYLPFVPSHPAMLHVLAVAPLGTYADRDYRVNFIHPIT